jgi:NAD(P)-dependent dehydrogenase (short-subunit alcohol dehydrogenase family)
LVARAHRRSGATILARGGGLLIHSASGFELLREMTFTAYSASKAALFSLSRFLATRQQGIHSNVVATGFLSSKPWKRP